MRTRLLSIVFLLTVTTTFGQKYSNEFLSIGVGARAQALGNAVVAGVDDVTAGVWNPAGLARIEEEVGLQVGAMHAEWFAGVGKFDYIGLRLPLASAKRKLAVSMIRFGIDQIPNTLSLYESDGTINFDNVSAFSAADYAFIGSYAQSLRSKKGTLTLGANLKVIHRRIGPFANSWGFGADVGLQFHNGNWKFGVLARDVTSTFNAWSFNFTEEEKEVLEFTNNEIPISSVEITRPQLILGVARRFQFKNLGLTPELDILLTTDGKRNTLLAADPFSIDPSLGMEADYKNFLFFRVGVNQFQQLQDIGEAKRWDFKPGMGVGLRFGALHIDYAFTDPGDQRNTYSHVVSLIVGFKPNKATP